MIYSRLLLAKDLLSDDGVIFISIDDNELPNLMKIGNEIFGEQNFVANMIWQSTGGSNTGTKIVTVTENILFFAKKASNVDFKLGMKNGKYLLEDEYLEERGRYELQKLDGSFTADHYSPSLTYPIILPNGDEIYPGGESHPTDRWNWRWSKSKVDWGIKNGFIAFKEKDRKYTVYFKNYEKVDNSGKPRVGSVPVKNLIGTDVATTSTGSIEISNLFGITVFDFPKPVQLVTHLLNTINFKDDDIVLDFFSGSATTAHAVMKLNAEDGKRRKYILVQLPEMCAEDSDAKKAGYKTICELGEERIRRAGKKIKDSNTLFSSDIDCGFKVFKIDSTNMKDVYFTPKDLQLSLLENSDSDIKANRNSLDLLTQSMLDLGITLDAEIEEHDFCGIKYYTINGNDMVACFDGYVGEAEATELAKLQPLTAVFRDDSFIDDAASTNCVEIFKTLSPRTILRIL